LIGAIDGDVIPQVVGGQIGGMSSAFVHNGCILLFTHRHTQAASAPPTDANSNTAPAQSALSSWFMEFPW
jgi:hypothetical protein